MPQTVYVGCKPFEGSRSYGVDIDFSVSTDWVISFLGLQYKGQISHVLSLYIDNLDNPNPVNLYIPATQQNIDVPKNTQAYVPLLATNPPLIQVLGTSPEGIRIEFLNFYMPPAMYGAGIDNNPTTTFNFILLESGDFILLEAGGKIELE